jgi:hypothetical protein
VYQPIILHTTSDPDITKCAPRTAHTLLLNSRSRRNKNIPEPFPIPQYYTKAPYFVTRAELCAHVRMWCTTVRRTQIRTNDTSGDGMVLGKILFLLCGIPLGSPARVQNLAPKCGIRIYVSPLTRCAEPCGVCAPAMVIYIRSYIPSALGDYYYGQEVPMCK